MLSYFKAPNDIHCIIVWLYCFSKKIQLGQNFLYNTLRPMLTTVIVLR